MLSAKELIEKLSKLPPETEIIIKGAYGETYHELGEAKYIEDSEAIVLNAGRATKTPVIWKDIPDYGNKMTIQDFRDDVKTGYLIDDDGHGYYAQKNRMSNVGVHFFEDFVDEVIAEGVFTHVVWFNK